MSACLLIHQSLKEKPISVSDFFFYLKIKSFIYAMGKSVDDRGEFLILQSESNFMSFG